MKKYLALMGAAILIMALAMPAAAQMLTKSYGHMEIQTVYEKNRDFNTNQRVGNFNNWYYGDAVKSDYRQSNFGSAGNNVTYKDIYERFRWFIEHGDDKTVKAVIGFEGDSSDWGEALPTDASGFGGGRMGRYTADTVQLEIKWAYLDFVLPSTPVTVRAGIQPWNYGGRLFVNNDAAGVRITSRFAPHLVEVGWWRENDDSRIGYEVRDNYMAQYMLTQKQFNFYVWTNYLNQNRSTLHDNPYWVGVGGGLKPGNFDLSGQIVYVGGNREDFSTLKRTFDYSAFAAELLGYYNIGPGLRVGLGGFYSTGNDANNQETKINWYPVATASEARSGFGNDMTVFYWMASGVIGYQHNHESAFAGFWYGRLVGQYSPTKWLQLIGNILYIGDTSSGTPGPASALTGGTKWVNSPQYGGTQAVDKSGVGQEINLIAKINIYKGFGYNIGLGVFIPGDIYDVYNASGAKTRSAETAYAFNTRLRYDF